MAEPVAGLLSPSLEEEFSSPYVKQIVDAVQEDDFAVIYHNCGDNVPKMLDSIMTTGCAAYHFGNAIDMERDISPQVSSDTVVMGNIDPAGTLRMGTSEMRFAYVKPFRKLLLRKRTASVLVAYDIDSLRYNTPFVT